MFVQLWSAFFKLTFNTRFILVEKESYLLNRPFPNFKASELSICKFYAVRNRRSANFRSPETVKGSVGVFCWKYKCQRTHYFSPVRKVPFAKLIFHSGRLELGNKQLGGRQFCTVLPRLSISDPPADRKFNEWKGAKFEFYVDKKRRSTNFEPLNLWNVGLRQNTARICLSRRQRRPTRSIELKASRPLVFRDVGYWKRYSLNQSILKCSRKMVKNTIWYKHSRLDF